MSSSLLIEPVISPGQPGVVKPAAELPPVIITYAAMPAPDANTLQSPMYAGTNVRIAKPGVWLNS